MVAVCNRYFILLGTQHSYGALCEMNLSRDDVTSEDLKNMGDEIDDFDDSDDSSESENDSPTKKDEEKKKKNLEDSSSSEEDMNCEEPKGELE